MADVVQDDRPKYLRLRDQVAGLIGSLDEGAPLPSEREFAAMYDASRMTIRRALDDLERDGHLTRRHGSGTFAAKAKIVQRLLIVSFSEDMRSRGLRASSRLVSSSHQLAGPRLGARLQIAPDARILVIERLRAADGEPMAIERLHVQEALVPGMKSRELVNSSFYALLRERYGIEIAGGTQTIEATVADEAEAPLLEVPVHSPALFVERTTWTRDHQIVEFTQSTYRGDRYRFTAELTPPSVVR